MYKILISQLVVAIVLFFSSCGGRTTSENSNRTHTHSDGTVHSHDGDHDHLPAGQESFILENTEDTTDVHDHPHDHDHHHDHPHSH
jgi:hypothetical protein